MKLSLSDIIDFIIFWAFLSLFEPFWASLSLFQLLWATLSLTDFLFVSLVLTETLWPSLCLSEPLCVSLTLCLSDSLCVSDTLCVSGHFLTPRLSDCLSLIHVFQLQFHCLEVTIYWLCLPVRVSLLLALQCTAILVSIWHSLSPTNTV